MPGMTASIETLTILVVPDPILKARARQVATGDMEKARALVPRMFATMYAAPGIGLAAPCASPALTATNAATLRHTHRKNPHIFMHES